MTVSQIVKDLLTHNMITAEAATVLLSAETKANMFDKQDKNTNQVFQPYHGVPNNGTTNPYYVSTTSNDVIVGTTTTGLSTGANELLKIK
jgi:murein L,D-transpeptidase YcbB/YkuD